jgi:hypothetical protein
VSILIDIPAALVAPRPCAPMAWRDLNSSSKRAFDVAEHTTQDGRTAFAGGTYVTSKQHFSIRSGPPTSRPPA